MIEMAATNPWGYGADDLNREEPGWTIGDLIKPGMLIASGPGNCPYLIERVSAQDRDYQAPCWGLTGWYAPGGIAVRDESRRWWLNGQVAVRYAPAPLGIIIRNLGRYDYECPARDHCFIVVGDGAPQNRAGQLGLNL